MNKHYFTEEQIEELKKNIYVKSVTEKTIVFTTEFKEHFFKENTEGKGPTQIFVECGVNIRTLGYDRVHDFGIRIRRKAKNNMSFDEQRGKKKNTNKKKCKFEDMSESEKIKYLEHEIIMLKAENDLLKKMEFLIKQKRWKKYQQKKGIN